MKKFSERSKRGQRNLIIFYSMIGLLVIFLFALLNTFHFNDNTFSNHIYTPTNTISAENTADIINSVVPTIILPEYKDSYIGTTDDTLRTQISEMEDEFVFSMLSLLGRPIAISSDTEIVNTIKKEAFLDYGINHLAENYIKEDFYEISYNELRVGDIAVFESGYGFYIGKYNGKSAFITTSCTGSIFSISNPLISLVYDATHNDELCNGWYPVAFTNYYHLKGNKFSEGSEIELSIYYDTLNERDSHYASQIYSLNKIFRNADFVSSSALLNISVPQKSNFYFNSDKYIDYFRGFVSTLSENSEYNIKTVHFSISKLYTTTSCCIVGIEANFIKDSDIIMTTSFEYSLYMDGSYLPFNVFAETGFSKYGFTHLGIGEHLVTEEGLVERIKSQNGYLIQKSDGRWVLRGGGFEQDVTDMIENEFSKDSERVNDM